MSFRELHSVDDFTAALAASTTRPIVIFKHSRTCGTSAQAYDEVAGLLKGADLPADVYIVAVQGGRAVSNAVESHFRIRHESPQVLIVHHGQVVWHASHFRVTASAIERALAPLRPAV